MKQNILLSIIAFMFVCLLNAQSTKITGKIIDENSNTPIEFATIKVLKTNKFSISNSNGTFAIDANEGDAIEVTHLSYKTKNTNLKNNQTISLQLAQIELNEIIVSSNPLEDISHSEVIVDQLKRVTQPRSVGDLFRDIKGFGIVKRGAYASEPVFRSFKYEQLNVQYDGGMKILNACPNRMDPITTHVIPEEVAKIEIVKGPFTVRFGQNFGGVINIVTNSRANTDNGFRGSIQSGFESNGENTATAASFSYFANKVDIHVVGSYRDFGNYKDGNGTEVPSSFKTADYSVKIGVDPTENQRVQFTWRQSFARDILHAGLPMDSPFDNSLLGGIDYKLTEISEKIESFTAKVFYSYVDHLMTNEERPSFKMTDAASPVQSTTYGGKVELVIRPSEKTKIFTGIDANFIGREGNRTRIVKIMNGMPLPTPKTFVDKIWQDATLNDVGVFGEGKFIVANNLTLTTGVRADFINTGIDDPAADFEALYGGEIKDQNEVNISANASLKYQHNKFQAQFALGRGVRTANMIERYINHFNVGVDPYEYVGNPNLNPEINNQIELSFMQNFKFIEIGASVFYSFLQDYISAEVNPDIPRKFMPTTPPVYAKQFINLDKAMQTGFEFNFKLKATKKLAFTSDLSYTYAQNKDFDEPLPQIPPFMAILGLKFEESNYFLALSSRLVAKQDRISTTFMEEESPSFTTVDFRAGYQPVQGLSIGAAVLNIFDEAYYEHLNYSYKNSSILSGRIYEPGRNFTVFVKYSF
ncbi:iron complex outermembrane recepter protein [Lutibacter agarilyticus]|uniref:Iron complex outermembrane recepter protein n=1 Tax=Lutibacter agarilyticus TaxID=1109740 RepID=A0A238X3T2_9FLAO|nr:TonB-dependent receptor [Lutibacter agarilyticus]SNR52509.1 iron complex outermembrane recepter protein [Lutibacter agarilyticus]